jgi:hypothetical protein
MSDDHLRRSIRAISSLQYGIALIVFLGSLLIHLTLLSGQKFSTHHIALLLSMSLAVFVAIVARALRKLQPWARTASVVFSFVGLLVVPLGTLLCGPFLYVLVKSKHLFAPEAPARNAPREDIDRLAA